MSVKLLQSPNAAPYPGSDINVASINTPEIIVDTVTVDTLDVQTVSATDIMSVSFANSGTGSTDVMNVGSINFLGSVAPPQPLVDCAYQELTIPLTGAATTSTVVDFSRISKNITLEFSGLVVAATANASLAAAAASIPVGFRPERDLLFPVYVINNSGATMGAIGVGTNGSFNFVVGTATPFTNAGNCGYNAFAISYNATI